MNKEDQFVYHVDCTSVQDEERIPEYLQFIHLCDIPMNWYGNFKRR